jgi:hypothetical protein
MLVMLFIFPAASAGAAWSERDKLLAADGNDNDNFGCSVSISGDYAIVGAWRDYDSGDLLGSAYIFKRDGLSWSQKAKLTASDGIDHHYFGTSVSISGDYAIVGANNDDENGMGAGAAYIFTPNDVDPSNWDQQAKLTADDGALQDLFGYSVSISGDYAVIGAIGDDDAGNRSGSAYIFYYDGANWSQQDKLLASDGAENDWFGWSVSVSGDYAIVGAYLNESASGTSSGSAYIFKRDGTNWSQQAKLIAADGAAADNFACSVSVSGNYAIVGDSNDNDNGTWSGAAYLYDFSDPCNIIETKLTASDGAADDYFGGSVSISGDYAVVGASYDNDNGTWSGSAYLYDFSDPCNIIETKLTAVDPADYDRFGISVSISGDYAVVGAAYDDDNGHNSGSVYVFGEPPSDTDGDGIADEIDNCLNDANPGQSDIDADGTGDICDSCPADPCDQCNPNGSDANEISADNGGTVQTPDGVFRIDIDPCDLAEDTTISITQTIPPDPNVDIMIGSSPGWGTAFAVYDLEPDGLVFNSPVTVTITADVTSLNENQRSRLGLYLRDAPEDDFVLIESSNCNTVEDPCGIFTKICTVEMEHFSTIAMVIQQYVDIAVDFDDDGDVDTNDLGFMCDQWLNSMSIQGQEKLTAADGDPNDYFGGSVSISGDYAIVGARLDDENGTDSGSAYIFTPNDVDPNNWDQVAKLTADDGAVEDYFGNSVSISGNYAIVGASRDDDNGDASGSAYIFTPNDVDPNNWDQVAKLTADDGDPNDYFGNSVSISGDYAIVGAYGDDDNGAGSGSAYIFTPNDVDPKNWDQVAKLTASDGAANERFGNSVSISGDYAIVAAYWDSDNGTLSGSAYIFTPNDVDPNNWDQVAKLTAADGASFDFFGNSVSISGDYAVVGALWDDDSGSNSGSAYVFQRIDTTWFEQAKLLAADGAADDHFGNSVSISGNYAIVGASRDDDNATDSGSAYVFQRIDTTWFEQAKLLAADGAADDHFGFSVSISGDYAIAGAYGDDDSGSMSGSAYVFEMLCPSSDLTGDCLVNFEDLAEIAGQWLQGVQ